MHYCGSVCTAFLDTVLLKMCYVKTYILPLRMKEYRIDEVFVLNNVTVKRGHTKTIVWTHQRPNKAIMANQINNAKQTAIQQTNFVDS